MYIVCQINKNLKGWWTGLMHLRSVDHFHLTGPFFHMQQYLFSYKDSDHETEPNTQYIKNNFHMMTDGNLTQ